MRNMMEYQTNKQKVRLGNLQKTKREYNHPAVSGYITPSGKFWKRYYNKKVRQSSDLKTYKHCNYFY